jgi:hypothetical protein
MFNYFSKLTLVTILSTTLINLQVSSVYAGVTTTTAPITTDSKGVTTARKQHNFDKIKDENMLTSLTMLAGGFIAGRMMASYRPITTDVMIAGAAGAAFIAGEVMSNMKFRDEMKAISIEVDKKSDSKVNEEQVQRLQDLRATYEKAKGATETKGKLQKAAAVAFFAASATAGYLAYTEFAAMRACNASLFAASSAATACIEGKSPTLVSAAFAKTCSSCVIEIGGYQKQMTALDVARQSPGPSLMENNKIRPLQATAKTTLAALCKVGTPPSVLKSITTANTACGTALSVTSLNQIFAYPLPKANNNYSPLQKHYVNTKLYNGVNYEQMQSVDYGSQSMFDAFLKGLSGMLIPEAQASWLPLLGLSGATALSFFALTGTAAVQIDMMMFVPFNRAIAFAGFGALSLAAANSSSNVVSQIDEHIAKIDKILNELTIKSKGSKTQEISQQTIAFKTAATNQTPTQTENEATKKASPCMQNNSSENCKPLANQLVNMPGFGNLPESFKGVASQAVSLGDSLSGSKGVSGSAISAANALGSKSNAIAGLVKKQQEKLLIESGGKLDAAKGQADFFKRFNNAMKNDLRKNGQTATGLMASLGMSPITEPVNNPADDLKKMESSVASVGSAAAGSEEKKSGEEKSLDLDFSEQPLDSSSVVGTAPASTEYEIETNDISKEDGPSLFDLISSRYIKSGYPKLLEEEIPEKK